VTDYTATEAYARGLARAAEALAAAPPPSRFKTVSTDELGTYKRVHWQLCTVCSRAAEHCTCPPDQETRP